MILASIGVSAYTLSTVLTRELARTDHIDIVTLTSVPLVTDGGNSLLLAFPLDGSPRLTVPAWTQLSALWPYVR